MSPTIANLLALADAYAEAAQVNTTTVSWRVFNDSKKLKAIREGADIQVGRFEGAVQWFSDNWPEGHAWPESVERPVARSEAA